MTIKDKLRRFDARAFLLSKGVEICPPGHKHHRRNWTNIRCPFCGNAWEDKFPLGWNEESGYFHCYRCGFHPTWEVVKAILGPGTTNGEVEATISRHLGRPLRPRSRTPESPNVRECKLPPGSGPLGPHHIRYLEKRGFDPEEIESLWKIKGTGHLGPYKWRIIAPVFLGQKIVSYQGRDITGKSPVKYKACPMENEVIHHKHILYGLDLVKDTVVVVEGILDAWRIGPGAVATFGTGFTYQQVEILRNIPTRYVMFDPEPEAQEKARSLAGILSAFPGRTSVVELGGSSDPAELGEDDVRALRLDLGLD